MDIEAVRTAWRRAMEIAGEEATLVTPDDEYEIWIKSVDMPIRSAETQMPGGALSSRRRFLVLFEEIDQRAVAVVAKRDRIVADGRTMMVMIVDDTTRRMAGNSMAIEVEVTGA